MFDFQDRADAGQQLAQKLLKYKNNTDVIVLGLPRGGVVTAFYIAQALQAPFDIIVTRKLGAPDNPELALGALAEDGSVVYDREIINLCRASQEHIDQVIQDEKEEALRRVKKYRDNQPLPALEGKIVVLVDDGIATGATMEAAVKMVKNQKPARVIIAVPVLPHDICAKLQKQADGLVYLLAPKDFTAISVFYKNFAQTTDDEVIDLLKNKM